MCSLEGPGGNGFARLCMVYFHGWYLAEGNGASKSEDTVDAWNWKVCGQFNSFYLNRRDHEQAQLLCLSPSKK